MPLPDVPEPPDELDAEALRPLAAMLALGVDRGEALELLEHHTAERICELALSVRKRAGVKNPAAFFLAALRNEWEPDAPDAPGYGAHIPDPDQTARQLDAITGAGNPEAAGRTRALLESLTKRDPTP